MLRLFRIELFRIERGDGKERRPMALRTIRRRLVPVVLAIGAAIASAGIALADGGAGSLPH